MKSRTMLAAALFLLGVVAISGATFTSRLGSGSAAELNFSDIASSGPLEHVFTGEQLSCQVAQSNLIAYSFYPDSTERADCGTLLLVNGVLYAPDFFSHDGTSTIPLGEYTPFTPVSQSAVLGIGTAVDPFRVVTIVDAGATGVRVTQTDSYVTGETSYRTDLVVANTSATSVNAMIVRAVNCSVGGSNFGYGWRDSVSKSVACTTTPNNVPEGLFARWTPITAADHSFEGPASQLWTLINAGAALPDTCACSTEEENAAALSWSRTIAAGGSAAIAHSTAFSSVQALAVTKTADTPSVAPGAVTGYTITIDNPNVFPVGLSPIEDQLPSGFTYVDASTSGVVSSNPDVFNDTLTWWDAVTIPATSQIMLHFSVTAPLLGGTYLNQATAASFVEVIPAIDTAPVTVQAPTPTPTPTSTATSTATATVTATPTHTSTPLPTATSTLAATSTPIPTNTSTATATNTTAPTATNTPTPTSTATSTRTALPTATSTPLPTNTSTATATATRTSTPLPTATNSPLPTSTSTPTATATSTSTPVPTATNTPVPTNTLLPTATATGTATPVPTATNTPLPTSTSTATTTATRTSTPTPTATSTPLPTRTSTATATATLTNTPAPTATSAPLPTNTPLPTSTSTATATATRTNTPVPTATSTPLPTNTPLPTSTSTATATATRTNTPVPTATNTPLPTNTPTATSTSTATATATRTNTPVPTATSTPLPTNTPLPTSTSTATATATPTNTPVPTATSTPLRTNTPPPTNTPTSTPTATASPAPTATPPGPTADCPDVDGNGQINIVDVFLVAQHLGKKRFDPRYDINRDGRVDGRDLQLVLRAMGRIC